MGLVNEVSLELSRSLSRSETPEMWLMDLIGSSWLVVSGVPPPWKPKKPAGETLIVVPVVARTDEILLVTAWCASSMEIDSPMDSASMAMMPTERMVLRKALRSPRTKTFMYCSQPSAPTSCGHLCRRT